MRIIEVLVSSDGQTRIETQGFTGSECRQASQPIEEALGHKVSEQLTAEFHQANAANSLAEQRA